MTKRQRLYEAKVGANGFEDFIEIGTNLVVSREAFPPGNIAVTYAFESMIYSPLSNYSRRVPSSTRFYPPPRAQQSMLSLHLTSTDSFKSCLAGLMWPSPSSGSRTAHRRMRCSTKRTSSIFVNTQIIISTGLSLTYRLQKIVERMRHGGRS